MELINLSRFSVQPIIVMGRDNMETLLVVVKATYVLNGGEVHLSERQDGICMADEYHSLPGNSSLRSASDTALYKPATDVILLGSAYPRQSSARILDVVLQAGRLRKVVRVFGDRHWLSSERISEPLPFDRMPLVFEKAFGGMDDSSDSPEADSRNPVGIGFRAKKSKLPVEGTPLPNLENPAQFIRTPMDRPDPMGTGFVPPHWEPRLKKAGTYDVRWQAETAPFLPDDYDPSFQQAAPQDQVYPGYMEGGEPIIVENASPSGQMSFSLPAPVLDVSVRMGEDRHSLSMKLDTVVIDGDASTLKMVWRGNISVHNKVYEVDWIRVAYGVAV